MLRGLYVENLALIRRLNVEPEEGFTVLTGETGAGKSLILDSLNLFLSSKTPKDLVRHGEEKMEVSLFFDSLSSEAAALLSDLVSPEEIEEGITLSRTVSAEGKSRARICGRTVPVSALNRVASALLSVHGQNDQGGLLDEKRHRLYLDGALTGEDASAPEEYARAWEEAEEKRLRLEEWKEEAREYEEKSELWEFQMREIAKVKPKRGEEEALEEKLLQLNSREKQYRNLYTADRALTGGEKGKGALFLLEAAARKLEELGENDPMAKTASELYEIADRVRDLQKDVSFSLSQLGEEDPQELADRIRKRLDLLYRLKTKYKTDLEGVISLYETLKEKKDLTLSRKDDIKRAEAEWKTAHRNLLQASERLTLARRRGAERLEREIGGVLRFLDMPRMRFFIELEPLKAPSSVGAERVRFAIAPNEGEGTKPLAQIASGGELSRVMLALLIRLGRGKDADTLVFDEIDTGISGSTAQKVGICLKILAETKQIFCVTHSAQVASLGETHLRVEKKESEGRTETFLTFLSEEDRLREVARLLGGKDISREAMEAAKELKREGQKEFLLLKDTWEQ